MPSVGRAISRLLVVLAMLAAGWPALAQQVVTSDEAGATADVAGAIVALEGRIRRDANLFYLLPGLQAGQTLSVHVQGTSGNLDPFVGVVDGQLDDEALERQLKQLHDAVEAGRDLPTVLPEVADELFLVWDDDGGQGYDAAFTWPVPAAGDYQLLVVASPESGTFGDVRLLIGLDAPEVLGGEATPRGTIAVTPDTAATRPERAVQELGGALDAERPEVVIPLEDVRAGDQITVLVQTTSGDLVPTIALEDFGGKPVQRGRGDEAEDRVTLRHAFAETASDFRLRIGAEAGTAGAFRLLIGLNAPEVLAGGASPGGRRILAEPSEVQIGIRMDQITDVDQKAENFGVVADLRMVWRDPRLAFSPDGCQCRTRLMPIADFFGYAQERGTRWPENTLFNQQGRRWGQGEVVELFPDGRAIYSERFSATLQAPDFDFRKYPFDQQTFFIRFLSLFPESEYVYADLEGYSALGEQLGEEEWLPISFGTLIDSVDGRARFSYRFDAERHLAYYVVRIFLPVLLIILVSWAVFFLRDFAKRIDLASANLLLFIAFNFTISGDLPRLGYLTFLDTVLICTFVITALVLAFNVYLRWLEVGGREASARALDRYVLWIYPLGYLLAFGAVAWFHLR